LHNEVPGVVIPDEVLARMESAGDDPWRAGRAIALELIDGLRAEGSAGIYLMPQFGRFDMAADIVEAVRA
jgi:homocysteine S-methyltransferase